MSFKIKLGEESSPRQEIPAPISSQISTTGLHLHTAPPDDPRAERTASAQGGLERPQRVVRTGTPPPTPRPAIREDVTVRHASRPSHPGVQQNEKENQ